MNIDEKDDLIFFLTTDTGISDRDSLSQNDQNTSRNKKNYKQLPHIFTSFDTKFDKPLYFNNLYECALIKIIIPGLSNKVFDNDTSDYIFTVLCNIVEESYVNSMKLPILRQFFCKKHQPGEIVFSHPVYIPLRHHEINNIHIDIVDEKLEKVVISESGPIVCVLKLRRIEEI